MSDTMVGQGATIHVRDSQKLGFWPKDACVFYLQEAPFLDSKYLVQERAHGPLVDRLCLHVISVRRLKEHPAACCGQWKCRLKLFRFRLRERVHCVFQDTTRTSSARRRKVSFVVIFDFLTGEPSCPVWAHKDTRVWGFEVEFPVEVSR